MITLLILRIKFANRSEDLKVGERREVGAALALGIKSGGIEDRMARFAGSLSINRERQFQRKSILEGRPATQDLVIPEQVIERFPTGAYFIRSTLGNRQGPRIA